MAAGAITALALTACGTPSNVPLLTSAEAQGADGLTEPGSVLKLGEWATVDAYEGLMRVRVLEPAAAEIREFEPDGTPGSPLRSVRLDFEFEYLEDSSTTVNHGVDATSLRSTGLRSAILNGGSAFDITIYELPHGEDCASDQGKVKGPVGTIVRGCVYQKVYKDDTSAVAWSDGRGTRIFWTDPGLLSDER